MRFVLFFTYIWAQNFLSMGARLQATQSTLICPTDRAASDVSLDRTQKAGLIGFFSWGWTPHFATGIEIAYQGTGQRFYGIGVNGDNYTAQLNLHYLRGGLSLQPQYAKGRWGVWSSLSPGLSFLTQAEMLYQGDSLPRGKLTTPQVIQTTLSYLDQSTDPNDRLILTRMHQRIIPVIHFAGGMRILLAPQVWLLGLISYERSLGDIERKNFRPRPGEAPIYDNRRRAVQYQLVGLQIGLQYEVSTRR
ncbi:MAG: hypothetical protein N2170_03120 [Bacteroidia bacterium]|nr:hypothetical protein [Bacteroidia bacterium]